MMSPVRLIADAAYREQVHPAYSGNPLIEALPPIRSRRETAELLIRDLDYREEHRLLPIDVRRHFLAHIPTFFAPIATHLDLAERVEVMLRLGYESRNPLSPEYRATLAHFSVNPLAEQPMQAEQRRPARAALTSATSMTLIGPSGIGKSTLLEGILDLYPQVIRHRTYKGRMLTLKQVTYLKLECPCDGSIKALCAQFFASIDSLLDTEYHKRFVTGRSTVHTLRPQMACVAANQGLGLLVIDEIQHLSAAKSGGEKEMLNFFVQLVNTIGLPVVLVGTYRAQSILSGEFRQARRAAGQGDCVWDRMSFDATFEHFCSVMWEYQYVQKSSPLTAELLSALYDESQGITDIVVKLYILAQRRAMVTGTECIEPSTIHSVAIDSLRLVRPILQAIKQGDLVALARLDDVVPLDINRLMSEASHTASIARIEHSNTAVQSGDETPASGPLDDRAIVDQTATASPLRRRGDSATVRKARRSRHKRTIEQGSVMAVVADRGSHQSAHDALVVNGMIHDLGSSALMRPAREGNSRP